MSTTLAPVPSPVVPAQRGVASWAAATRVQAGLGAAGLVGVEAAALGRRALIITDANLAASSAVADARTRCAFARVSCAVYDDVRPDPDLGAVAGAVAAIRDARPQVVIGLGGGSVLDVAKTAAWAARNPQLLDDAALPWQGGLARPTLSEPALRPALPTVMLPSTIGTGAEVSAVVCLSRPGDGHKRLVIDPALHPSLALIDPTLTRTLPRRLCLQGALETFVRLLVPYLTDGAARPLQDGITFAILRTIVAQAGRVARDPDDDEARLALSLATVASHVAWANTGRPVGGHVLWYLANPVSPAAGVDKVSAIAALTPAYLCHVSNGVHERLGRPARLGRVGAEALGADGTPSGARAAVLALLREWGLPASLTDLGAGAVDPDALTAAAHALWGDPELLGAVPADAVRDIYRAALRPAAPGNVNREERP
jgi:NADP-dependent alcohol dehydrogenase